MILDTERENLFLRLGALAVPVTDYQVLTEVPVQRTVLCDGSQEVRLLPAVPCVLRVTGTVLQNECGTYLTALQTALRTHRSFDTVFAGMQLTGLQLTAVECSRKHQERTAALSLSLIGGIEV